MARAAADPGARQSRARDPAGAGAKAQARRRHRDRPLRLSEPGQQRPVLSVHLPRRARRRRHDHQPTRWSSRPCTAIAELAQAEQSDIVAAGLRRADLAFGPDYLIPQAVRSAPDRQDRAGGGQGGDGQRRRDAADQGLRRLPRAAAAVRLPLRHDHEADVRGGQGRRSARRIVYAEGEEERVLRAVQVVVDEKLARPMLIGRPDVIERAHRALRPAAEGGNAISTSSIPSTTTRYRDYWQDYHRLDRAPGRDAGRCAKLEMRRRHTLIGAMTAPHGRGRRHALRHLRHIDLHLHYIDQVIGRRAGVNNYYAHERADAAAGARCSSATPTSTSIPTPSSSPR